MKAESCCSRQTHHMASTVSLIVALALVVMAVALSAGMFGPQGKYFLMAGSFLIASIPLFIYGVTKNLMCRS